MERVQNVVTFVLGLGASVLLPIIIFFLSIIFGAKPGKSVRSALMVGVGIIGIGMITGLLGGELGPASQAMVRRMGIQLSVIDVGWPAAAAIAFGSPIAALIIPAGVLVNLLLLLSNVTKTLNVDIWNFWHYAFVGALVQSVTGNIWMGLASAMIALAATLFFADWTAPAVQQLLGIPGISLPHGFSTAFVLPAILVNKAIDRVPGLNRLEADPETIRRRLGVFGEPVLVGFVIGLAIAALGYAGSGGVEVWLPKVLRVGISMAAVMVLYPRVVALIMEGLIPISEAARDFLKKKADKREVYIGLDSAIAVGHPVSIATSLLMVPVTLILAAVLPGNKVLPFGDLATVPFLVAMMVPVVRGNVVRATLTATVVMIPTIYIMNAMSGLHSQVARASGFAFPEGVSAIASICDGGNWISGLLAWISRMNFWAGNAIVVAVLASVWFLFKRNAAAWHKAAGYIEGI